MPKMKAIQVSRPRGDFELVERPLPEPAAAEVRLKVEACGICHSDYFVKDGLWPGLAYPRVPGHEIAGRIDAVGKDVSNWQVGQKVGVGWHGGHCFVCDPCRTGDFINCARGQITGLTADGGYAEYMVASQEAVAAIPEGLAAAEAAPLLCAGITTYNALRNSGARGGDRVAIQGVGGLGHLAIQYAAKMGFIPIAVSAGKDKEALARRLGAMHYIDAGSADPARELKRLGGAHLIFATAPSSKAILPLVEGLTPRGKLLIVAAAADALAIAPVALLSGRTIAGWPSGSAKDSEDALSFSAQTGVRPMIESYPLEKAGDAFARMMSNQARFRVVLTMGG